VRAIFATFSSVAHPIFEVPLRRLQFLPQPLVLGDHFRLFFRGLAIILVGGEAGYRSFAHDGATFDDAIREPFSQSVHADTSFLFHARQRRISRVMMTVARINRASPARAAAVYAMIFT
jgi:hypothetical protein